MNKRDLLVSFKNTNMLQDSMTWRRPTHWASIANIAFYWWLHIQVAFWSIAWYGACEWLITFNSLNSTCMWINNSRHFFYTKEYAKRQWLSVLISSINCVLRSCHACYSTMESLINPLISPWKHEVLCTSFGNQLMRKDECIRK